MKNKPFAVGNARKRSRPSALLSMAALLGCIGIYTSLELRSGAEAIRWGAMALLLFILSLTVRKEAGSGQPFPLWGYLIPLLLVGAFTTWDISREASPGGYEEISNGIADATDEKAVLLRQRVQAVTGPDGLLSRWDYAGLARFMRANDYPQRAQLAVSQDAARYRLQRLVQGSRDQ